MKVIGLWGKANQGKTTMLNQLIERLKQEGAEIVEQKAAKSGQDKRVFIVIKYKEKRICICICIATYGDVRRDLEKNCAFFDQHHPDIVISATRTHGETREVLEKYAKKHNTKPIWIEKCGSEEKEIQTELNNINIYLILKHILGDSSIKISQSFEFEIS